MRCPGKEKLSCAAAYCMSISQVVGIVEDRMGEYYRVNIFGSSTALLPILAFDGATKRNKPNLKPGALVYSRMAVADKVSPPFVYIAIARIIYMG
jgi:exosome complex RNA-binding protein Rrp4